MNITTMNINTAIDTAIAQSVTEVNLQQPGHQQLADDPNQPLSGEGGVLDSLGILLFVTALESRIKPVLPAINLVDALMNADNVAHFATLGALKGYLRALA